MQESAWIRIRNSCLKLAEELLSDEHIPAITKIEAVRGYIELAVMIDSRWNGNKQEGKGGD